MLKTFPLAVALAALAIAPAVLADEAVVARHAVIIAGHPEATKLGLKVLAGGGNAMDALVTTSLALGVAEPGNSGLGGKFVMTYYDAKTKRVTSVVAMDAAPLRLPVDQVGGWADEAKTRGWGAVCTPGLAAALGEAHARWGTKPWRELLQPDIDLATRGVVINDTAAEMLTEFPVKMGDPAAMPIYAPGGQTLPAGATLKNPDLAAVMSDMAEHGYRAFYTGDTARKIVAASAKGGGFLSMDDFTGYHARFLEPLAGTYHGLSVYSSPPPLTGGSTLLAALGCLENADLRAMPDRQAGYIDLVGRVMRQVYPAVAAAAADTPDAGERVQKLLTPANLSAMWDRAKADDESKAPKKKVASASSRSKALAHPDAAAGAADSSKLGSLSTLEASAASAAAAKFFASSDAQTLDDLPEASTTHLIIVDAAGDIACVTQSLGLHFGAGVVAGGTGILFNADLSNFSFTKNSPNAVAAGKWPRSTMTPTIFLKDDKPVLAIGSPAGQRIPTAVLQVSLDVLDYGRDLKDAIRAARFHVVRGKGDNHIDIESAAPAGLEDDLAKRGWDVTRRKEHDFYFGSVNAVQWMPDGTLRGVADQRRTSDAGTE